MVGAEINRHMCDVAEECLASNGCLGRVTMLDRDVRRMTAEPGPDGAPADLERRVDLLVYEVGPGEGRGQGVGGREAGMLGVCGPWGTNLDAQDPRMMWMPGAAMPHLNRDAPRSTAKHPCLCAPGL